MRLIKSASELERYGGDWSKGYSPAPSALVMPRTIEEVQASIRWAIERGISLVPSGGRTGLSGGAVAARGEVVVSMENMRRVLDFDATDRTLVVEAGVTTFQVQEAAREQGLFYPVDFASRGSSQIGGNIATNAGGIKVLRYGLTRNWVKGLKVVTGAGDLLDLNKGLVKNATGYDLRHLFVGSEGTLGIVVEATLQLTEAPPPQQVMVFALPSLSAVMHVFQRLRRRLTLSAFEFFTDNAVRYVVEAGARYPFEERHPYYVLAEFDENETAALECFEDCLSANLVSDGVLSYSAGQAIQLWHLREGITDSLSRYRPYKNDISVRVRDVPPFLERVDALFRREYPVFQVIWFGHIGDGNLHISILPPESWSLEAFSEACGKVTEQLGEILAEYGGSISAEHGVGLLKKPYLHWSRSLVEIELMRQMKRIFDPACILNPGKVFDC